MKLKSKAFCKNHVPGIILVLVTLFLCYKFMRWNWYKVEDTVTLARNIIKAPGPKYFEVLKGGKTLYNRVFRYRKDGQYLAGDIPEEVFKTDKPVFKINGMEVKISTDKSTEKYIKFKCGDSFYTLVSRGCNRKKFIKIFRKLRGIGK